MSAYIRWFDELGSADIVLVGGKNASLGEMIRSLRDAGVRVPDGFAVTVEGYRALLEAGDLIEPIRTHLERLHANDQSLRETGAAIRALIEQSEFPEALTEAIMTAYRELGSRVEIRNAAVAVRSSATAEDLPTASFAGQLESFLNVRGEAGLLAACHRCFASLFTDRAIAYREVHGFDHLQVEVSVGVQQMVAAHEGGSGVMFSIDTESGFPHVVVINAAWGLGETVVQGTVDPDEYVVFKPLLDHSGHGILDRRAGGKAQKLVYAADGSASTVLVPTSDEERRALVLDDAEAARLATWAMRIEEHYGCPMDMEWARDGETGELFIVQARPETVHGQAERGMLRRYILSTPPAPVLRGQSVGQAIASGPARVVSSVTEGDRLEEGDILVTAETSPDWVPLMRRAAAIVTDRGGRTSHAAIVSRELGVPAVIGTGDATRRLRDGQELTVSCAAGTTGYVYEGLVPYETLDVALDAPPTRTEVMMTVASPESAFDWWRLPTAGIGLARMEFVIDQVIRAHPMALIHFDELEDAVARDEIEELTRGYERKADFFVDRLSAAIARIAASQYPRPVIVRTSDFKSNEYADLIGGRQFEPIEANPMLGLRGASRYYSDRYREGFELECAAIRCAREEIGLDNVVVMIPFCRTVEEADRVLEVMSRCGLERGVNDLQLYMMCEIPSNVVLAEEFAQRFDGFSIGSNDLTQLVLGVDRDSSDLRHLFDEENPAVTHLIRQVIEAAHAQGVHVGFCGQAPSDRPEYAAFLVDEGIDSISVNPDSVMGIVHAVAAAEQNIVPD
jgi:pyruvate, water dikinase